MANVVQPGVGFRPDGVARQRGSRLPAHRLIGRAIAASGPASPKLLGERRGEQGVARGVPPLGIFLPIWIADSQITFYVVSER